MFELAERRSQQSMRKTYWTRDMIRMAQRNSDKLLISSEFKTFSELIRVEWCWHHINVLSPHPSPCNFIRLDFVLFDSLLFPLISLYSGLVHFILVPSPPTISPASNSRTNLVRSLTEVTGASTRFSNLFLRHAIASHAIQFIVAHYGVDSMKARLRGRLSVIDGKPMCMKQQGFADEQQERLEAAEDADDSDTDD
jgi:hypothetical protein